MLSKPFHGGVSVGFARSMRPAVSAVGQSPGPCYAAWTPTFKANIKRSPAFGFSTSKRLL